MKMLTVSRFLGTKQLKRYYKKLPKSLPSASVMVLASFMLLFLSGFVYYYHQSAENRSQTALNTSSSNKQQVSDNQQQASGLNTSNTSTAAQTPQQGSSNTSKPSGSSNSYTPPSSNNKPYTPYNCVKTTLPYSTSYKVATYLGAGQVNIVGGITGYTSVCTPDSNGMKPNDANVPAVAKTIYVGDGGGSIATPIHTGEPYDQIYARVTSYDGCGQVLDKTGGDQTAYQLCITSVMHYYGY